MGVNHDMLTVIFIGNHGSSITISVISNHKFSFINWYVLYQGWLKSLPDNIKRSVDSDLLDPLSSRQEIKRVTQTLLAKSNSGTMKFLIVTYGR